MQDKRPKNEKGQPHGLWEGYYSNGVCAFEGTYVNGLRDGLCIERWSNGNFDEKGEYHKGKAVGLHESYWCEGKLHYKGHYKDDNRIGFWLENNKFALKHLKPEHIFYAR